MTRQTPPDPRAGCALPTHWHDQPVWRILDTHLDARRLLLIWQAWQADARRPTRLHLVALCQQPPPAAIFRSLSQACPTLRPLADEVTAQWQGLLPGFHRLSLAQGRLQLTLCVGDLQTMLREQQFFADTVYLDASSPGDWDRWCIKALARSCRRGTELLADALPPDLTAMLAQGGFAVQANAGRFDPQWELKHHREPLRTGAATPASCAVIGAGLAGASVADALARRGWQVTVLDAATSPAAGASGLPAGLMVPHVSADDSPRSRLSRAGLRLSLQAAQTHLREGEDWAAGGVLEIAHQGRVTLPEKWTGDPQALTQAVFSAPGDATRWQQGLAGVHGLWHTQAGWIKPAKLVQAWLSQPGVRFVGGAHIASLQRQAGHWLLQDADGKTVARATHLVLANAGDAWRLLRTASGEAPTHLPDVQGVRGQLSWGLRQANQTHALPPYPVNGLGSLIPAVPTAQGTAWFAGATYEAIEAQAASEDAHHEMNLDKLGTLLPAAGEALAPAFACAQVQAWRATRWVSADRLPLVGPLEDGPLPGLWISAAMGSRGLSFAPLCAELLASRLGAEPWPLAASLARFLHARRRTLGEAHNSEHNSP